MAKLKPKTRTRSRPIRGDSGELKAVDREILGALTEFRDALADGTVGDKFSIRTLKLDVPTGDYGAADVRGIREGFGLSQAAFALIIGASVKTGPLLGAGAQEAVVDRLPVHGRDGRGPRILARPHPGDGRRRRRHMKMHRCGIGPGRGGGLFLLGGKGPSPPHAILAVKAAYACFLCLHARFSLAVLAVKAAWFSPG